MRVCLHIGPDAMVTDRIQSVLEAKRAQLLDKGVLYPRSPGGRAHSRLFMLATDPDQPDTMRANRGFASPEAQEALRQDVARSLLDEIDRARPDLLILSSHHLGAGLTTPDQIARVHAQLAPYADQIEVIAHVEDPARMLLRRYAGQILDGRIRNLNLELSLCDADNWWDAALATAPKPAAKRGLYSDTQMAVHWLDYTRLVQEWDAIFGTGATRLFSYDPAKWAAPEFTQDLRKCFGIDVSFGKATDWAPIPLPPASWLARCRRFNEALLRLMAVRGAALPRQLCRRMQDAMAVAGPADQPGQLAAISDRFAADLQGLLARHPGLRPQTMKPDTPQDRWTEAAPQFGFRATQYLHAFMPRIETAFSDAAKAPVGAHPDQLKLSRDAEQLMSPLAKQKFASLVQSPFAPHNRLGGLDETVLETAFTPAQPRQLPDGRTGRVIVACMKTEAPYILEWIAYHRAIGVDNFLIYTNGCEDTTDPLLVRLQELGIVHHRSNEGWQGQSPQQHALNNAMKDPVVQASDWIIHIDVDEFINVRCGNGTLDDFFAHVPDATNVAMTWRLFGHNGVQRFEDQFVIGQFDACAPRYCPKPHMAWGFKSMSRNIGAYSKLSCHRPNHLHEDKAHTVKWVNGSGQPMTGEALHRGWRNSKKSIGYDLLQLNHYPLRSAESFLVKRQRGRALHVDRTIGLNYWIRMDWTGAHDVTIQRNIPRVRAEYNQLIEDPLVRRYHEDGVAWHRAKAKELHETPEFEELFQQATALSLTETERAALALAMDVES